MHFRQNSFRVAFQTREVLLVIPKQEVECPIFGQHFGRSGTVAVAAKPHFNSRRELTNRPDPDPAGAVISLERTAETLRRRTW
jgi:hypothetical protein